VEEQVREEGVEPEAVRVAGHGDRAVDVPGEARRRIEAETHSGSSNTKLNGGSVSGWRSAYPLPEGVVHVRGGGCGRRDIKLANVERHVVVKEDEVLLGGHPGEPRARHDSHLVVGWFSFAQCCSVWVSPWCRYASARDDLRVGTAQRENGAREQSGRHNKVLDGARSVCAQSKKKKLHLLRRLAEGAVLEAALVLVERVLAEIHGAAEGHHALVDVPHDALRTNDKAPGVRRENKQESKKARKARNGRMKCQQEQLYCFVAATT